MNNILGYLKSQHGVTTIFLRRLLAIIYDSFLLVPILMLAGGIMLAIQPAIDILNFSGHKSLNLDVLIRQVFFSLTVFSFFSWFWIKNGQTLGMQSWRIKLVSVNGETITLKHTILRFAGAIFSTSAFGLGYFWILFDKENRTWHDIISKTRIVLISKI